MRASIQYESKVDTNAHVPDAHSNANCRRQSHVKQDRRSKIRYLKNTVTLAGI
jgi:hypothetical protein